MPHIVNHIKASVVVEQLISQVILGVDFLQQQYLVLDFTTSPVSVTTSRNNYERPAAPEPPLPEPEALQAIRKAERVRKEKVCIVTSLEDTAAEEVDEYAIPAYNAVADVEFPGHVKPCLEGTIRQARDLIAKIPGLTKLACHQIDTLGPPARVPPRRIPAHFQQEVQEPINDMLKKGIIVESISSWLAPAVYTRKKTGEIRLCVDYREIPVDPKDQEKTAFSPGPGMGLFQFTRMPFGLCGTPSTFQRLMDLVMRGLPFVTTYLDDVLIHSANEELHKSHLQQTFQRLREAGLTLGGSKCEIGMNQVTYLGHTFAREGMAPDGSKVDAVVNWPQPRDEVEVRRFLGLASYYRKYIDKFADIAAPLHQLTQNSVLRLCTGKDIANGNANALSRREPEMETSHAAMTTVYAGFTPEELKKAQKQDDTIQQLYTALNSQQTPLKNWKRTPMRRYAQLWSQLEVVDGIVGRRYKPGPTSDTIVVPVLPEAQHQKAMSLCHDSPTPGHQGTLMTWERIRQEAYWKAKLPMPVRSTLTNIPIGRPWQMIAIDIVEVPVSTKNNRYLLVIQVYFTKWADARPLKDQTAVRIKAELVKLFCTYGIPEIVHSDQGRSFESSVVQSTLDAFGVVKRRTTPYHPQGDGMVERFNRSLLQLLRTYVERQEDWEQHLPLALGYEATSYQAVLQAKMAELQDLVEAHVAESAHRQKVNYD
eukprot:Em0001g713a